jgi:hypothetical protein
MSDTCPARPNCEGKWTTLGQLVVRNCRSDVRIGWHTLCPRPFSSDDAISAELKKMIPFSPQSVRYAGMEGHALSCPTL